MASFVPVIWESKWFGDLLLLQRSANPSQANDRVGNTNATFSRGRTPLNTPVSCPAGVSWVHNEGAHGNTPVGRFHPRDRPSTKPEDTPGRASFAAVRASHSPIGPGKDKPGPSHTALDVVQSTIKCCDA